MANTGGGGLNLGQKLGQGFQLGGVGQQQGTDSVNVYWVYLCSTYNVSVGLLGGGTGGLSLGLGQQQQKQGE